MAPGYEGDVADVAHDLVVLPLRRRDGAVLHDVAEAPAASPEVDAQGRDSRREVFAAT